MDCNELMSRHVVGVPKLQYPWEYLAFLRSQMQAISFARRLPHGGMHDFTKCKLYGGMPEIQSFVVMQGDIFCGKDVRIGPFTFLRGPLVLGDGVQIGPHVELTRCIVGDRAQITHKNIIVDSVVGTDAVLAGFVTTCNCSPGRDYVVARHPDEGRGSGSALPEGVKYGAMIGDRAQLGVALKLMPGCYVPDGEVIPGPGIVFGANQQRTWGK